MPVVNIKQLRIISEIARHGLNVSRTATALHASQPGVTMQIQRLEAELGLELFVRKNNRLTQITPAGQHVIERAERALLEIDGIREIGREHSKDESGTLVVAASHGQARHTLPAAIRKFEQRHPKVRVRVEHGTRRQVVPLLMGGEAHIGVMSDVDDLAERLILMECARSRRIVLVPQRHRLLRKEILTLSMLAEYPIVLYEPAYPSGYIAGVFDAHGIALERILLAPNSDVMKAYVEQGLGISVLPAFVFDPKRDTRLRAIDVSHLFRPSITHVMLHRKQFLRGYAYAFIETLSPRLTRQAVEEAMA